MSDRLVELAIQVKQTDNNTMHRSPAGRVFTWTVAGQGPVIVDVIR